MAVPLFVPGGRSFVPACACRRAARKGLSRTAVALALPLASVLPGHAFYEAFQVKRYFTAFFTFTRAAAGLRRLYRRETAGQLLARLSTSREYYPSDD